MTDDTPTPRPAAAPPAAPDTDAAVIARMRVILPTMDDYTESGLWVTTAEWEKWQRVSINGGFAEYEYRSGNDPHEIPDIKFLLLARSFAEAALRTLDAQGARIAALEAEVARLRGALVGGPEMFDNAIDYLESDTFMGRNDPEWIDQLRAKAEAIRAALTSPAD